MRLFTPRLFICVLILCSLANCSSGYRAPVEDRQQKPKSAAPSLYHVQRGDTLYSITWRYGLDYRSVASANGIASPYTIYPGQKLYLKKKAHRTTQSSTRKPSAAKSSPAKSTVAPKPTANTTAVKKTSKAASPPAITTSYQGAKVSIWRWPARGKITRRYSSTVHKGIDISGKRGDAIVAVAAGKVVYAGAGIVGYGEMLIVKHNDIYLSAYGHNSRLLVSEGQQVKAGQKIAEKGNTGTDTVKLHFEIRKEGKPVDPQKLLP